MANLQETNAWEPGIYQLEETDPVQGGANGIDNVQAKQLANRTQYLKSAIGGLSADMAETGRDLLAVLGVSSIPAAMAELRRRCNNLGEINDSKIPDFTGIMIGDYIDGLSLNGIAAPPGGTAPAAWNNTYKNNRIVVSGFNTYRILSTTIGVEVSREENNSMFDNMNCILFTFRHAICTGKINFANSNAYGYDSCDLKEWLCSLYGEGTFASQLRAALGGNYIPGIHRVCSDKRDIFDYSFFIFLPTEIEVFGHQTFGDEINNKGNLQIHFPIYAKSALYRRKKHNGVACHYWLQSPRASDTTSYCCVDNTGKPSTSPANGVFGISPAFCVA